MKTISSHLKFNQDDNWPVVQWNYTLARVPKNKHWKKIWTIRIKIILLEQQARWKPISGACQTVSFFMQTHSVRLIKSNAYMVKHYCTNKHLNVDKRALVTVAVIFTSMALKVIILKRFLSTRAHTLAIIETNKMDWKTKPYQMKEKICPSSFKISSLNKYWIGDEQQARVERAYFMKHS